MSATVAWQTTVAATDTGWAAPASNKLVYKAANDNTDDLNNPLIKPSGATPYNSYFKPLKIVVGGTYTSLTNLRVLLSAAYSPATVQMWYKFSASYIDPTASQPPASTTGYTQMSTSPANWTGGDGPIGPNAATDPWGQFLYAFIRLVDNTVTAQQYTGTNIIARYDEI